MDFTTFHKSLIMLCLAVFALMVLQSPANAKAAGAEFDVLLAQNAIPSSSADERNTELQKKRMCLVGAACGAVVGTILILFGYFRLNHATRGFYAGRLQTLAMVMVAILLGLEAS